MSSERVFCIAAHPDDEALGCGGTIAKHVKDGDHVSILILTNGYGSRGNDGSDRVQACMRACGALGVDFNMCSTEDYPDNKMDTVPLLDVAQCIEGHIMRVAPSIVYTHSFGDMNVDHRVTHRAVNVACRPQPGSTVRYLLYFEIPCSTAWGIGFHPNYFVDITDTIDKKLESCRCYAEELRPFPHPRSEEGIGMLALWRGSMVGMGPSEAFEIGRIIT